MFTGLVEEIGAIRGVSRAALGSTLEVACPWRDLVIGESIAVDGVCLSVVTRVSGGFTCDASAETLAKTTLGSVAAGHEVHLERAMRAGDRLGGHIVSGHVDGVGRIVGIAPLGEAIRVELEVPRELAPFCAPKASITVDGVSLTINGARDQRFDVVLVPITRDKTRIEKKGVSARVNLEVDVLAKYVERLLATGTATGRVTR
jgi:riboflavin synthase